MIPKKIPGALLERFALDREAARTESGVLYDATEKATNRRVSIEIGNDLDDDARLAFERDAMISQRLEGEHILRVMEVGALIDGTPYVVREPALGSLANDVATRGALPTSEAVAWTLEVCEALAEAHSRGIAHGDIRAETVFLARDAAGNPIAKVRWTSKAKAEGTAREDVARDIAGTAYLLRFLITAQSGVDDDAVKTLPTDLGHAVARATAKNDETRFRNIGELAAAIARYAPADHQSARNVAFLMSRAGIVGAPVPIPVSQRMTSPNPMPVITLSDDDVIAVPSSRRVPISAPISGRPSQPGLNEAWFAAPPPTVPRLRDDLEPVAHERPRRRGAGGAVAALLVAGVLGATLYLWKNNDLPQWSGTAPPTDEGKMEPISHTEVTSALVDTTLMTPPPALEKNQAENGNGTQGAPMTALPAEEPAAATPPTPVTEETSPKAPMDTKPSTQAAPSSAKAKGSSTTTTDDTMPAKPWAGTSTPPTSTPRPSSTTDDTTPGGMSPTPAPSAPDTTGTSAPSTSPTTESTTSPSSPSTPPATDSPGF